MHCVALALASKLIIVVNAVAINVAVVKAYTDHNGQSSKTDCADTRTRRSYFPGSLVRASASVPFPERALCSNK